MSDHRIRLDGDTPRLAEVSRLVTAAERDKQELLEILDKYRRRVEAGEIGSLGVICVTGRSVTTEWQASGDGWSFLMSGCELLKQRILYNVTGR